MKRQLDYYRAVSFYAAAVAAVLVLSFAAGCRKSAKSSRADLDLVSKPLRAAEPAPERSAPASEPPTLLEPEPTPTARTLEQRFVSTASATERGEIADEICGLDTAEAAEIARRLFRAEPDEDVKVQLLTGIAQMKQTADREQDFGLLIAALVPTQPRSIRVVAISLLTDSGDSRAARILTNLKTDADAEIREAATEALRELEKAK